LEVRRKTWTGLTRSRPATIDVYAEKPNLPSAPSGPTPKTPHQHEQWGAYEKITTARAVLRAADEKARAELALVQAIDAQATHHALFESTDLLLEAKR